VSGTLLVSDFGFAVAIGSCSCGGLSDGCTVTGAEEAPSTMRVVVRTGASASGKAGAGFGGAGGSGARASGTAGTGATGMGAAMGGSGGGAIGAGGGGGG